MKSAHRTFDLFLDLKLASGRPVAFISELTPARERLYQWIPFRGGRQVAYQSIKAIDMALAVWRAREPGAILIFEHKPQYALLLYLACLSRRVPVFFFSHGLQQLQSRSLAHRAGFSLLQALVRHGPFWAIHLELGDDDLPLAMRYPKSLLLPHPVPAMPLDERAPFDPRQVRLGVVGMLRPDKPVLPLINALSRALRGNPRFSLTLGTPFWQLSDDVRATGVALADTTSAARYNAFLASCDIVVTDFERRSFFFRPSGVINDALAAGCYVLAPDFPVFAAQLSQPCKVGATYASHAEMVACIEQAADELGASSVDFTRWRQARRGERLLEMLASRMDAAVAPAPGSGPSLPRV